MNKYTTFLILALICILLNLNAYAENNSLVSIIDSLGSDNPEVVDSAIKSFGIEKGASSGFKKYQILRPWSNGFNNACILALSWDPPDGYILYIDNSGKVLSKFKTGYVISLTLQERDELGSSDLIIVNSTAGYGSGYQKDAFAIYSISQNGLNKIWEGISYLKGIYVQGEIIYGMISFIHGSNRGEYKLRYTKTIETYSYNKRQNKFIFKKKENISNDVDILQDGTAKK